MYTDHPNTKSQKSTNTASAARITYGPCMYACSGTSCAHWHLLCCRDLSKYWQTFSRETVTIVPANCISLQCTSAPFDCLFVLYSSLRRCKGRFENARGCCLHEAIASPVSHPLHITNIRTTAEVFTMSPESCSSSLDQLSFTDNAREGTLGLYAQTFQSNYSTCIQL